MSRAAERPARQVLLVVLAVLWVATASNVHARPGHRDASDRDGDGVVTERDNCILVANESQLDSDSDGFGNACDLDFNDDGVVDRADAKWLKRIARSRPSIGHPDFDPRLDVNADGKLDRRDERAFRKGRKVLDRAERNGEPVSGLSCAGEIPCPEPNFVVIYLDDTRADGVDRMPTVQHELRRDGLTFANAFTPNAACCPSRASLYTGLYSINHGTLTSTGAIGGAHRFRESGFDTDTFAVWLHEAGYATGLFGKYLNNYSHATEGDKGPGGTFYLPPAWDRWWALTVLGYGGIHGRDYQAINENRVEFLLLDHSSDQQYSTDLSARRMLTFIDNAHAEGAPFLAVWLPWASHVSGIGKPPVPADRHYDTLPDLPPHRPPNYNEADLSDKPRHIRLDPPSFFTSDRFRQRAYESLLSVDEQIDTLLGTLRELGIDRNTVVVFTSDNGVSWGEHWRHWQRKACPYEECQRVPFVVMYKGGTHPALQDTDSEHAVLNIDIAPTLAEIAGVEPGLEVDGASMLGILRGYPEEDWRQDYLIEHWRIDRATTLSYSGQVADGDQVRLFYGDTLKEPRDSILFEFDSGDGVEPGASRMPIGERAADTFATLARWTGPITRWRAGAKQVTARHDETARQVGVVPFIEVDSAQWWIEKNSVGAMSVKYWLPDHVGVRDVAEGYSFVRYDTGERELYDLRADPFQLENRAGDPRYEELEDRLHGRLEDLLSELVR